MSTLLVSSAAPREGRTTVTAALGALLAAVGRTVRLGRLRAAGGADPGAEDDARALAGVPGCTARPGALTEQDALAAAKEADSADALLLLEAPPDLDPGLASRLSARIIVVSNSAEAVAPARTALGDALTGAVLARQPARVADAVVSTVRSTGVPLIALLPEDRLLAGPSVSELAETLHASRLVEGGAEDEAVEYVMLGPISADPGQPYFMQHGSKAVVNRFDKMDLHLAALATEPDCLVLTGGQMPSPYLLDRVANDDVDVTVLLSPEGTVRTVELLDGLFGQTRFTGTRKLARAIELFAQHVDRDALATATGFSLSPSG